MNERELRNNLKSLDSKFQEIKSSNDKLLRLHKEKKNLVDMINHSFSIYASNYLKKDNIVIGSNISLSKVRIPFNKNNNSAELINAIYTLLVYENIENEVNNLYDRYFYEIDSLLEKSKPILSNGFVWAFKGKNAKETAIEAANCLLEIYQDTYLQRVYNINAKYGSINYSKVYDDFLTNTSVYVHKLNQFIDAKVYEENDPKRPDFSKLQKDEKTLLQTYNKLQEISTKTNSLKQDVINKANLALLDETLNFLKEIPIDEINREKLGFKINALKSAGIETVYDAYNSSAWNLSSINGISENMAYSIKQKATEIKNRISQSSKLKLNVDNKTEAKTNLLHALYLYTENKNAVKEIELINERFFSKLKKWLDFSMQHDNVSSWHAANYKEKMTIVEASKTFSEIKDNEYVARAKYLINNTEIIQTSVSDKEVWDFFEKNSSFCYSELDKLCPGMFGNSDSFYGLPEELAKEIQDECFFPDGLLVTLRRYQEWGVKYILHQKNVLLGDEMGLGKTIQAIAAMVSLRNTGAKHFLVVCPASVIINWCREVETHSKLRAIKVHGRGRKTAIKQWIANDGVAVTTYETTGVFNLPKDFKFDMLTVDEAHYCKNPEANRTINVRTLSEYTDRILYMTGTALENKVDEMIELISHLQPKVAEEIKNYSFMSAHETFKQKVAPVYYRRKREDVLTELPELIVNKEWCTLNKDEKEVYENTVLNGSYQSVRRVSWNIDDLSKSCKMNRLKEIIQSAKDEGRKVIVFSYFLDTISKIRENLGDKCSQPITGSINPRRRQEIIDDFNDAPSGSVLLAQIQAGGTGLNIQSASVVVITEPQFKPSIENQAISRAYRMGQTRNVLVHRLLCENTVDEKLMDVLEEKQMIFDAFADESVAAMANKEIDEKTFGDIIKEEIERIKAEKERNEKQASDNSDNEGETDLAKILFDFS